MKKIFHPAFLVLMIVLIVCGYGEISLIYLLAVSIHELAHAFVAKKLGYKLRSFYLMPYGACLSYEGVFLEREEFYIAIAGPLSNLLVCLLCLAFWWVFPVTYAFTEQFFSANFFLALMNFLPAFPLDGGRILLASLSKRLKRKTAIKISLIFNFIFCFIFVFFFVLSCFYQINLSFLIMALFLIISVIGGNFQASYEKIFYYDKNNLLKKGINTKIIAISSLSPLYKVSKELSPTKYNVFFIVSPKGKTKMLSENAIRNILENNDLKLTFADIFNQFD